MPVSRTAGSPGRTPPGSPYSFDFTADPVLQTIRAMSERNISAAEAAATGARSTALESFGYDPALESLYGDANVAGVARANPFSTLSTISRAHAQRGRDLSGALAQRNLGYSSYGNEQVANEQHAYLGEQTAATQKLQQALAAISEGVAGTRETEAERDAQAAQDAYERALNFALEHGGAPPGAGPAAASGTATGGRRRSRPAPRARARAVPPAAAVIQQVRRSQRARARRRP